MDPSKSSPAVAGDRVFVGIDRNLTALDRRTGRVLWQAPTGRKVDSTPLASATSSTSARTTVPFTPSRRDG